MKTFLSLALAFIALSAGGALALTSADHAALRQLTQEYAVIYQARYPACLVPNEDAFQILRARWNDRDWRLVAFPRVTAFLRQQLNQPARRARD